MDENEIVRTYGKYWNIEVFFKFCKSYLHLSQECRLIFYDAMTAHTAIVFAGYMMLSLESRESNDERSLSELFLYFSDEMSDIMDTGIPIITSNVLGIACRQLEYSR